MDGYEEFIPPMPVPTISQLKSLDPMKVSRGYGITQSRSEGQICPPKPLQIHHHVSQYQVEQTDGTDDNGSMQPRGRVPSRDIPRTKDNSPGAKANDAVRIESRKRSRSPVKRLLGLGKSQSMKEIPQEKEAQEPKDDYDKKAGLKMWGDRLRHGFLVSILIPTAR